MSNQADMIDLNRDKTLTSSLNRTMYFFIKRLFDVLMAIIGIIAMIPIALIVKVSYMLTGDFDSIFYKQKRIGKNGEEFDFYKFRSMIPNADEVLKELLKNDKKLAKEYKINKKLEHDPRVTKMGNILRKTSLDELPQVLNIIKNDMSVIGNRPYLPREKEDMGIYYNDIIKTKPGLTGLWQVSGRSNTTFEERLKIEQEYSNGYGFRLDVKIFFKTFGAVFKHKGAK